MKQERFSDMEYRCRKKKTKREEFQEIIPWEEWVEIIRPYYPVGKRGRPPIKIENMLGCICCNAGSACRTKAWRTP